MGRVKETKRQAVLIGDATVLSIVVTVVLGTYLLVTYGPRPRSEASTGLVVRLFGRDEPADRLVLALWLSVIGVAVAVELFPRLRLGILSRALSVRGRAEVPKIAVPIVTVLLATSVMWNSSSGEIANWPSLSLREVAVGLVVVAAVYLAVQRDDSIAYSVNLVFLVLCVAWVALLLWQAPGSATDAHHFTRTLDEIIAPGAGKLPLGGYIPQYTNLLGYPIAPLVASMASHAADIGLAWMIVMQLIAIIAPGLVLYINGGRRIAGVLLLVLLVPVLVMGDPSKYIFNQSSYFPCFPLRYVLPMLLFSLVVWRGHGEGGKLETGQRWLSRPLGLGVAIGAVILNNPDFGAPAGIAVVSAFVVAGGFTMLRSNYMKSLATGVPVPFVLYWLLLRAAGRQTDLGSWLFYQRSFGSSSEYNAAMSSVGLHTVFVATFIVVAIVSLRCLRISNALSLRSMERTARLGFMTCVWSMLTIPYFAGRSYESTLIGGHAFQFALVCACLISLLYQSRIHGISTRGFSLERPSSLLAVGAIAVLVVGAYVTRLPGVSQAWDRVLSPSRSYFGAQDATWLETMVRSVTGEKVVQVSGNSTLIDLTTSIKSALVFNHPEALGIGPSAVVKECQKLAESDARYLVDRPSIVSWLASAECAKFVTFAEQTTPVPGTDLVLFEFIR